MSDNALHCIKLCHWKAQLLKSLVHMYQCLTAEMTQVALRIRQFLATVFRISLIADKFLLAILDLFSVMHEITVKRDELCFFFAN
jgi:hypothetical protein